MFTYNTGERVKGGFYWNVKRWDIVTVTGKAGILRGGEAQRYLKLPTLLFFVVAPLMGLVYVMFLPLIGFVFIFGLAGKKGVRALRGLARPVARLIRVAEK